MYHWDECKVVEQAALQVVPSGFESVVPSMQHQFRVCSEIANPKSKIANRCAGIAKRPKAAVCRTADLRFKSGCPLQHFTWIVAQPVEHLIVNEAVAGSIPVDPPSFGAVAERLMHFAVDEDDDGSSPFGPAMCIERAFQPVNWIPTDSKVRRTKSTKENTTMFALKSPLDFTPVAT